MPLTVSTTAPLTGLPTLPGASAPERRTLLVAVIAAVMMAVEVGAGLWLGSMALLADGLHMASHTVAMGIAVFAYRYARRHAASERFVFGTGKVNALGGYTGAVVLGGTSAWMVWESLERAWQPVDVGYGDAALVATVGLAVNAFGAWVLRDQHHGHDHGPVAEGVVSHAHDHNLRAAYLHVMADAATSVLAIVALLAASRWRLPWLDPAVGIVGGIVVAWWSIGLLASSSAVLLDHQGPRALEAMIRLALTSDDTTVETLRCWAIGPSRYAVAVRLRSAAPRPVAEYEAALGVDSRVAWTSVEIDRPVEPRP